MALSSLLKAPATASGPRFPRNLTTLGFCWLHGRVGAVAVQRGQVVGTWNREDIPEDLTHLGEYVREAARATGYRGSSVSLLLAHPKLAHQLIETAPAKGAALQAMIRRQVDRAKSFEGPAAWSVETTAGSRNPQSHLLHLLPREVLNQMVSSVSRAGLHLVSVLPPTAVLHGQLTRLPIGPEEVAVIATDLGDRVTVVVGRKSGEILLARSIDAAHSRGAANFAVDLSRTILFVSQQFSVTAETIWLFGPGAAERAAELSPFLQTPVRVSPEAFTASSWAEETLRVPPKYCPNLISDEQRLAPQREVLLKVTSVVSLALVTVALASFGFVQYLAAKQRGRIRQMESSIQTLQAEHLELQRLHATLAGQEAAITNLLDGRIPPVPAFLLGYLGQVTPADLRVTEFAVRQDSDLWHLKLTVAAQPTRLGPGNFAAFTNSVATLRQSLATGPFHARLAPTELDVPAAPPRSEVARGSIATWMRRNTAANTRPVVRDRITLEGWMR
jgi:hypothetical protein